MDKIFGIAVLGLAVYGAIKLYQYETGRRG